MLNSCKDSKDHGSRFRALDENLVVSNHVINRATETILKSIDDKRMDPATSTRAQIWNTKASRIISLSGSIYNYIEGLKALVLKEGRLRSAKANELYDRLKSHKVGLMAVDSGMAKSFDSSYVVTTKEFDTLPDSRRDFFKTYFENVSSEEGLCLLSQFQNNIKTVENRIVYYCSMKIPDSEPYFDSYSAIIGQSSNNVRRNDKIEIVAGVGIFSKKSNPVVTVAGKTVQVSEDGTAHYEFRAPGKPGKYFVPVLIDFIDEFGKEEIIRKDVRYGVTE